MNIVEMLKEKGKTVATMESCTGGGLASAITNIPGASEVFFFGAVTYSNAYKIKMGVDKDIIDTYSVYSMETAQAMSKAISEYTDADYGIGITGKLRAIDKNNLSGLDNMVYISVYDKVSNSYQTASLTVESNTREEMKKGVILLALELLKQKL